MAKPSGLLPGRDQHGVGRIFIGNHRSSVDIPIMLTLAEAHPISRSDLANWPLLGRGARRVGTLFVDRSSRRSGADVLRQVGASLSAGEGVMMFPEGTSFPGDQVRPFHPGAFTAAKRVNAEVVPVGIAYGDDAAYYYKESFSNHLFRFAKLAGLQVAAVVGEPMKLGDRSPAEFRESARAQVQQLVCRAREVLAQG